MDLSPSRDQAMSRPIVYPGTLGNKANELRPEFTTVNTVGNKVHPSAFS